MGRCHVGDRPKIRNQLNKAHAVAEKSQLERSTKRPGQAQAHRGEIKGDGQYVPMRNRKMEEETAGDGPGPPQMQMDGLSIPNCSSCAHRPSPGTVHMISTYLGAFLLFISSIAPPLLPLFHVSARASFFSNSQPQRKHHTHLTTPFAIASAAAASVTAALFTMLADQQALGVTECAQAGTSYPPISTPTVIPPAGATCITGYTPGTRHSTYTLPYNLTSILPLISSFADISWTGAQLHDDAVSASVALNGTNNEPGTARTYTLADGATVVETLVEYTLPSHSNANGDQHYLEVHSIAPLHHPLDPDDILPPTNSLSTQSDDDAPNGTFGLYSAHDGTRAASSCGGAATTFNLTATFCATNVSAAERWFRARDADAMGVLGRRLSDDGSSNGAGDVTDCADVVVATGGAAGGSGAAPTPSTASHQQTRMTMGTAVSLVLGACMAFAALMA